MGGGLVGGGYYNLVGQNVVGDVCGVLEKSYFLVVKKMDKNVRVDVYLLFIFKY